MLISEKYKYIYIYKKSKLKQKSQPINTIKWIAQPQYIK